MLKKKRIRMLGVSEGKMYCTMASSTATGRSTLATLQTASKATAMPARMKALPKMMAPPPKKRSSSSWPLTGMLDKGLCGSRLASMRLWSLCIMPAEARMSSSRWSSGASGFALAGEAGDAIGASIEAGVGVAVGPAAGLTLPPRPLPPIGFLSGFLGFDFFLAIMRMGAEEEASARMASAGAPPARNASATEQQPIATSTSEADDLRMAIRLVSR